MAREMRTTGRDGRMKKGGLEGFWKRKVRVRVFQSVNKKRDWVLHSITALNSAISAKEDPELALHWARFQGESQMIFQGRLVMCRLSCCRQRYRIRFE